ncbi:hypothetical protein KAR91_63100 [Candidatus Pacearchaeota archaeon]|nr:hypothetical protein [Candidatus Pacearchaeota archaeon]
MSESKVESVIVTDRNTGRELLFPLSDIKIVIQETSADGLYSKLILRTGEEYLIKESPSEMIKKAIKDAIKHLAEVQDEIAKLMM